jgi:phosphatidylserine decarboxylase
MRIPLAREGLPFILSTTIPAIVLLVAAAYRGGTFLWIATLCLTALAVGILAFFRDPERVGPKGPDLVVSPADGKVIDIRHLEESSYMKSESLCVSIFLSLFDVHVNRYPVTGDVDHRTYDAGRFEPAWRSSASHSNERASTGIRSEGHPVLVRQIAGLAAKRIVTYAKLGDQVEQGERMGLIRFGSRVDVFLPRDSTPNVRVGQRAVGGKTVLAHLAAGSEGPE